MQFMIIDGAVRPSSRKPAPGGVTLTGASGRGRQTVNNAAALRQQQRKRQQLLEQRQQQTAAVSSDQMLSRPQAPPSPQRSMTDSQPSSRGDSERQGTGREMGKDRGEQREDKVTPTTTATNRNGDNVTAKELDEHEAVRYLMVNFHYLCKIKLVWCMWVWEVWTLFVNGAYWFYGWFLMMDNGH